MLDASRITSTSKDHFNLPVGSMSDNRDHCDDDEDFGVEVHGDGGDGDALPSGTKRHTRVDYGTKETSAKVVEVNYVKTPSSGSGSGSIHNNSHADSRSGSVAVVPLSTTDQTSDKLARAQVLLINSKHLELKDKGKDKGVDMDVGTGTGMGGGKGRRGGGEARTVTSDEVTGVTGDVGVTGDGMNSDDENGAEVDKMTTKKNKKRRKSSSEVVDFGVTGADIPIAINYKGSGKDKKCEKEAKAISSTSSGNSTVNASNLLNVHVKNKRRKLRQVTDSRDTRQDVVISGKGIISIFISINHFAHFIADVMK